MASVADQIRGDAHWRNHAFGLSIDSPFELVGFGSEPASQDNALLPVSLEPCRGGDLASAFAEDSQAIGWRRRPTGEPEEPDVLAHRDAGYMMSGPGLGQFRISLGGERIWCAPADSEAWRWQRYLLGRVLPFAATVRGLETWHAAAVGIDGRAIALMARSGVGKTTIAAQLVLSGARLLADDVIAVAITDSGPVVHPGPPLISLRTGPRPLFAPEELVRLGRTVGLEPGRLRISVSRAPAPLPLAAVYLLETSESSEPALEPLSTPDPAALLGGTFNFAIRTPERLSRQLDAAAAIARQVALIRVRVPANANLRELGAVVLDHAESRRHAAVDRG